MCSNEEDRKVGQNYHSLCHGRGMFRVWEIERMMGVGWGGGRQLSGKVTVKLIRRMGKLGPSMKRDQFMGAKEFAPKWLEHKLCLLSIG